MIHDFGLLNTLATLPSVKSLIVQAGAELKKYLLFNAYYHNNLNHEN
jgi:hypothetical protein